MPLSQEEIKYLLNPELNPNKICKVCGLVAPKDQFAIASWSKDGRSNNCKKCATEIRSKHLRGDKESWLKSRRKGRSKRRKILAEYKLSHGCADCGYNTNDVALDFHHIDEKDFNISQVLYGVSIERLVEEIGKCIILCANCHRIRTSESRKNAAL